MAPRSSTPARSAPRNVTPEAEQRAVVTVSEKRAVTLGFVKAGIADQKRTLAAMMGSEIDFQRFVAVCVWAIQRTPALLDCDPLSLLEAVKDAIYYELEPIGFMGEAAIVPYRPEGAAKAIATFQPMYRGLAKLARRSGEVAAIDAQIVYARDEFAVELGSDPRIVHKPYVAGGTDRSLDAPDDRGAYRLVYAWARLRSGELIPRLLSMADIAKRRQASQAWRRSGASSPWGQWPEPMMLKSAMKALCNSGSVPRSIKLAKLIEADDLQEVGTGPRTGRDLEALQTATGADALAELHAALGLDLGGPASADPGATDGAAGRPAEERAPEVHGGAPAGSGAPGASTEPRASGEPVAGDPGPAEPVQAVQAEPERKLCAKASPYGDGETCRLLANHEGLHRGSSKQSWADPEGGAK
jgi:recombination protein RecT